MDNTISPPNGKNTANAVAEFVMSPPSTLLLFAGSPALREDGFAVVPLGIHALSAYLKERGVEAKAMQLHSPVPMRRWTQLLRRIGERRDWRERFACRPRELLREIASLDGFKDVMTFLETWIALVARERPEAVGMTLYEANLACTIVLGACIKETLPDTLTIFGGPEVNRRNRHLLARWGLADAAVVGEGEEALFQLLASRFRRAPANHPGSHPPEASGGGGDAPLPPLNMESLPAPDFDELWRSDQVGSALPVAFNRGCVARCAFCVERLFWGEYRQTSVPRAVEIIASLKERYGKNRFVLSQSLMNGDMAWLESFAEALIDRDLDVYWGGNARIHPRMDPAFLDKLFRAGCRFFCFGIESGSGTTLREMAKGVKVETVSRVLDASRQAGIWNHAYWIFGYPGEDQEALLTTIDFIIDNAHRIHSHGYHIYNDDEAVGEGHRDIFDYVDALPLKFTRCNEAFSPHRRFANRLFEMEEKLAGLAENRANPWHDRASEDARETNLRRLRRAAHLRELTMGILRAWLVEPGIRSSVERDLTPEAFRALHESLEENRPRGGRRDSKEFPAALVDHLKRHRPLAGSAP